MRSNGARGPYLTPLMLQHLQTGSNGVKRGQAGSSGVKRGQPGSNGVKRGQTGSKGIKLGQTGHVIHQGLSSTGACRPPGHVVHRGMLSTGECCPPGHVVHQGKSSTRTYCHRDILSRGIVAGHKGLAETYGATSAS